MNYVHEVCNRCVDRHCCRGFCKEMNDYLGERVRSPLKRTVKVVRLNKEVKEIKM